MPKKKFNVFNGVTNVENISDLEKVKMFFRDNVGTTLDCFIVTGILRNSITYYVAFLEAHNEIQAIYVGRDQTTGRMAKHYSTDKSKWKKQFPQEGSLFKELDVN